MKRCIFGAIMYSVAFTAVFFLWSTLMKEKIVFDGTIAAGAIIITFSAYIGGYRAKEKEHK